MRLVTESTLISDERDRVFPSHRRIGRGRAPWPIVEQKLGEREAVLAWLNARAESLRHAGFDVRRTRFRRRRRTWAARITYDEAPLLSHLFGLPASPSGR